jgi:hypothetical protein
MEVPARIIRKMAEKIDNWKKERREQRVDNFRMFRELRIKHQGAAGDFFPGTWKWSFFNAPKKSKNERTNRPKSNGEEVPSGPEAEEEIEPGRRSPQKKSPGTDP